MGERTCHECENIMYQPMCGNTLCPIENENFAEQCGGFTQIQKCPKTVFDTITASIEVLAGTLVYPKEEKLRCEGTDHRYEYHMTYGSVLFPGITFEEYGEAFIKNGGEVEGGGGGKMSDTKYCKDCKNMKCPEGRVNCKYPDAIACEFYRDTPPTVFQQITASLEVLAQKLVYFAYSDVARDHYKSTIVKGDWSTESDAIAATVAKLKEVEK